jgi:hypothetical protein
VLFGRIEGGVVSRMEIINFGLRFVLRTRRAKGMLGLWKEEHLA